MHAQIQLENIDPATCVVKGTHKVKGRTNSVAPGATASRNLFYGRIILEAGDAAIEFENGTHETGLVCLNGTGSVTAGGQTFATTIEGKVDEPFDRLLGDWLKNASPGKLLRLAAIAEALGLCGFDLRQLRAVELEHAARKARGARQQVVVDDDRRAVAREVHVELEEAHAELERRPEGRQRVLGELACVAAVRNQMNEPRLAHARSRRPRGADVWAR